MRKSRSLSQLQLGQLLGVNQKRAARIEQDPGVTSFDQIARLVAALGGRIVIEMTEEITPLTKNKIPTEKKRNPKGTGTTAERAKGAASDA
jgi:HTH-type transcriptional regulator / antitoxin HipB